MSNLLPIQTGPPLVAQADGIVSARNSTTSVANTNPRTPATRPAQVFVNPSFRFDATIGLEVIEFHDDTGKLTSTIPSQRQLDAYRNHQEALPGAHQPHKVDGKTAAG